MTMKNRVPPSAASKPNVTATCIHNFLLAPGVFAISPETMSGKPNKAGANEEIDCASETAVTINPQSVKAIPYAVVRFGRKSDCSSMSVPCEGGLSVEFLS